MTSQTNPLRRRFHIQLTTYRLATLLLLPLLTQCGPQDPPAHQPPANQNHNRSEVPQFTPPENCLFIILDAFHAKHASMLGYARDTTPNIDALAHDGVYFSAAHSQSATTTCSVLSYLTGQYPRAPATGYFIPRRAHTLAEAFRDKGFSTGAFSANPWIDTQLNFDKGFQHFRHFQPVDPADETINHRRRRPGATTELIEEAKSWIESNADTPWFCYIHLLRPHTPYESPEPFHSQFVTDKDRDHSWKAAGRIMLRADTRAQTKPAGLRLLRDLYDGNIAYTDALIGQLVQWLESIGEKTDTLIVIASDHGEAFMQHGRIGHNTTVYQEMVHVPLVFHPPPGLRLDPHRVDVPVEMVDLYPTLADLFTLNPLQPLHGKSLLPLLRGSTTPHKDILYTQTGNADHLAVRKGDRKLILKRKDRTQFQPIELYDLAKDPKEKHNLLTQNSAITQLLDLAEHYRTTYFILPVEQAPQLTPQQIETPQAPGYLQ